MTDLPAPLTPADCDLRGLDYMPFHGARMYDSDFNARASDAEFRAAMALWWSSWQQLPAASLPDDDVVLCKLADLGRDVKSWKRVRSMAMHNFVLCSDGRYYHRFLAGEAIVAWEKRMAERLRKAKWRAQKSGSESAPERGHDSRGDADGDGDMPPLSPSRPAPRDADVPADGNGRDGTRRKKEKTTQPSFVPRADFERVATVAGLPSSAWSDAEQARLDGWLERGLTIEGDIVPAVQRWLSDPKHDGGTHTLARFDIPIADAMARKALPDKPKRAPTAKPVPRTGEGDAEREIRARVLAERGEHLSQAWIDPVGMRLNGEALHVTAPSLFHADWVRDHFGASLAAAARAVAGTAMQVSITVGGKTA